MTTIQQQFFALLRSGLWGAEVNAALFDDHTDWDQIYTIARKQAVLGVVFNGVQALPAGKRPRRTLYLQWCNAQLRIEEQNRLLNRELSNVCTLYRANGIEPVVLKGQGIGRNYPNPLHRQCGDIDLYIGERHYALANRLLRMEATGEQEENYKHTSITWHGIDIENHRIVLSLSNPVANRRFQKEISRWCHTPCCRSLDMDGYRVTIPPLSFEVAYILVHAALHALNGGIGLRQLCDWSALLYHRRNDIDRSEVARLLREWGFTNTARIVGAMVVGYLGIDPELLPVSYRTKDLKSGEWFLNDIWLGGNFGKYDTRHGKRPKGYWQGKWHTFTRAVRRSVAFGTLASSEAFWYPCMLASRFARIQCIQCRRRLRGDMSPAH